MIHAYIFLGKYINLNTLQLLNDECPKECSCLLSNLVRKPEGVLVPVVTVDCRNRGLLTMPSNLPSITTVLLLHGNNVRTGNLYNIIQIFRHVFK